MAWTPKNMSSSTCIFTIASKNYLGQVRTLLASVKQHHPDVDTCLVLCDRIDGCFEPSNETFQTVTAESLGIEHWSEFAFKYSCLELNTAIKPFAIKKLFQDGGYQRVIYLDPDIVVYRPLEEVFDLLESRNVVLTPHLTDFLPDDGCLPSNVRILQTGTNNLGFIALRRSERAFQLVEWWRRQLYDQCRIALADGVFVDQKWMDLVLSCVESSHLLHHPGYNVAYWNLPHRKITRDHAGHYLVNGEPLRFFHFSGFDPKAPSVVSKYQTRLSWGSLGKAVQSLYSDYRAMLTANGHRETSDWPYAYGAFDNGVRIPDCFRTYFHKHLAGKPEPETDVFGAADDKATLWGLFQSQVAGSPLTVGAMAVYHDHPELKAAFPDVPGGDALRYAHWFTEPGGGEAKIGRAFIEPVQRLLAQSFQGAPRTRTPCVNSVLSRSATKVLALIRRQRGLINRFSPRFRAKVKNVLEKMTRGGLRARPATQPITQSAFREKKPNLGVNVFGFLDVPSGVGEAARGSVACFDRMNIPVTRVAFDENHLTCGQPLAARPDASLAINFCHVNANDTDSLQQLFGQEPFAGRFNIGCWAWELEEFPAAWDWAGDFYNEIWAPTTFVQQAVAMRMRIPVVRIPYCIQIDKSVHDGRKTFDLPQDRPVILCMFDTASLVDRKNPMGAIEAVDRACAAGHDPLLVIKAARTELDRGLANRLLKEVKHVECRIVEGWLDRQQTLSLIEACDVFVSLHRSEGFGLILAEAMAYGKPVVATGYSGNMDFMNSMNSFPVDYQLTTLKDTVGPYPAGARWAEPDVEHAAFLIREILDRPEHARKIGRRAAEDIARCYSVEAVSELIRKRLESLGFSMRASADVPDRLSPAGRLNRDVGREPIVANKAA